MPKSPRWARLTALAVSLGCLTAPPVGAQQPLNVFAAASLTEAFTSLGKAFEAAHAGTVVRINFAGSQVLATQIEQGAGADVFASADRRWIAYLEERSLLSGEPVVFARNRLVVLIPRTNPGLISKLQDLARPGVKLVLAGPQVPAGSYSRQALKQLDSAPGFPSDFDRRVLANVVSDEENVRAVAAKVQLREADAGIVYRTDVSAGVAPQVRQLDLPACCSPIAEYPIAAVQGKQAELAAEFIALVLSPEGQRILSERGFLPPASAP
jgi:molybdate transport system substrate-binding protein